MTGIRVLVTRPQPGADQTVARLARLGFEPLLLPLTRTVPLAQALPDFSPQLVAATSPQAFHHLSPELRNMLAAIPAIVTGEGTAAAARSAGFVEVQASGGNVSGLLDALGSLPAQNADVLYLAGRIRRPELELFLQNHARRTGLIEVYDTISVSYSTDNLRKIAGDGAIHAVLITSVETVGALAAISDQEFHQAIDKSKFICLSARIAEAAQSAFPNRVLVSAEPTGDSLMATLAGSIGSR